MNKEKEKSDQICLALTNIVYFVNMCSVCVIIGQTFKHYPDWRETLCIVMFKSQVEQTLNPGLNLPWKQLGISRSEDK